MVFHSSESIPDVNFEFWPTPDLWTWATPFLMLRRGLKNSKFYFLRYYACRESKLWFFVLLNRLLMLFLSFDQLLNFKLGLRSFPCSDEGLKFKILFFKYLFFKYLFKYLNIMHTVGYRNYGFSYCWIDSWCYFWVLTNSWPFSLGHAFFNPCNNFEKYLNYKVLCMNSIRIVIVHAFKSIADVIFEFWLILGLLACATPFYG